jgi:hypothetical protein
MEALSEFVDQNPLNNEGVLDILTSFKIHPVTFMLATKYHRVEFEAVYDDKIITDGSEIGINFKLRNQFAALLKEYNIPFSFEMAKCNLHVTLLLRIILNDGIMPFDEAIREILENFAEQSHIVVKFVALTLAYEALEVTIKEIVWRSWCYQEIGLPPTRSSNSIILIKGPPSSHMHTIPVFGWRPIRTPDIQMASPVPSLTEPPHVHMKKNSENISVSEQDDGWSAPVQRKKSSPAQMRKNEGGSAPERMREIHGVGSRPDSVIANYNPTYYPKSDGISPFDSYFSKGKAGIKGVIRKDEEIYKDWTAHYLAHHHKFAGRSPSDPEVRSDLQIRLGPHYNEWVKIFTTNA